MPITAERLEVDVTADTSSARRELDQFSRNSTSAGAAAGMAGGKAAKGSKGFGMMAGMAAAAGATMLTALAGKTVMAASDLNEQVSKTGVVFGPQAKVVTDAAQQMADKFGMSKTVFLEAASGIGLVGKASGMTKGAAAGMSTEMARLAADASSFYNVPVTEALDAMKSGLVGEAEPLRRYGVLLNEATVQQEAARLGISKMGDELTEGQKVQARASLITKGMADANGDLERTQGSVANRVKELQGRMANLAADMGTKALPAAEKFLAALLGAPAKIRATKKAITDWQTEHPILNTALKVTAGLITAVFIPAMVRAGAIAVATKVKVVASFVAQRVAAAQTAAMVAVNMVKMGVFYVQYAAVTVAQTARIVAAWVAQKVAVVTSAAGQVAAFVALKAAAVLNFAGMAAAAVASAARVVAAWVLMGAQSMIQAARMAAAWVIAMGPIGWAIAAVAAIAVVVYKNWDKIKAVTIKAWAAVSGAVSSAWDKIKSWVVSKAQAVQSAVTGAWDRVKTGTIAAWNTVKSKVSDAWDNLVGAVKGGISKVVGFMLALPGKITGALGNLGSLLKDAGVRIITGLWDGLKGKWEDVKAWFGSITDAIPNLKGPRAKDAKLLVENGRAVMQGFKDGLEGGWADAKKFLAGVTKWVGKAGFSDSTTKELEKRLKRTGERVRKAYAREAMLNDKLAAATQAHSDAVQAKADFRGSTFSGMNNQANVMNSGNTGAAIAASLRAQVAKVQEFARDLATMAAKGLSKDAIAQVTAAGVDGGAQVAAALAAASEQDVASINASFAAIGATASSTADTLASQLHDAGIAAAQGVVDGLVAKKDAVRATLKTIADGMIGAISEAVKVATGYAANAAGLKALEAAQKAAAAKKAQAAKDVGANVSQDAPGGPGKPPRGGGGPQGPRGPGKPTDRTGGGSGPKAVAINFTTHNPVAEPQSRTTNRALARAAAMGLV